MSPLLAGITSLLITAIGYRARALSISGAATAFVVGLLVLWGTGGRGLLALGAFFVTSSLLSRKSQRHEPDWLDAPGHQRNGAQVAANGGVAAFGGSLALLGEPQLGLTIVVSSLAAAAGDTWATSIGMSSPKEPLDIWRWKRVPKGTSGGVSTRGTLGGVAGAITIASVPLLAGAPPALALAAASTGILGMLLDSLLGAIAQGRFFCDACGQPSERRVHRCGQNTRVTGGQAWLGNDGVNALATAFAGAVGAAWWALR